MIVDTHAHIVSHDEDSYPLSPRSLSGPWYREAPHSAEDLLVCMAKAGVDRAVLVQPMGAYSFDNRYTADSAAAHPQSFSSACCVDAEATGATRELRRWIEARGMQGVRLFALSAQGASWLAQEQGQRLWETAADLGIHVIVTIFARQLGELRSALERYPAVAVSLDHCGFPSVGGEDFASAQSLFELADLPNLHLKVSTHVLDAATEECGDAAPFVKALISRFGAERVMWGSDFCQTHDRSYGELVDLGRRAFRTLTPNDRDQCLGTTALRLWPALA